jgi:Flp pilus assembly protein TadG
MAKLNWIRRRGNAVLDMALVMPVLLSLTFGTVEFGHYFYVKHCLQGAAREGARVAITSTAVNSDVTTAVANSMAAAGLTASGYTVTLTPTTISGLAEGTSITVSVQCTWGTVGMRPLGLIGASKTVQGITVMRKEG